MEDLRFLLPITPGKRPEVDSIATKAEAETSEKLNFRDFLADSYSETANVANTSNCPVIISGGVSSIEDIKKAKELNNNNIEGIIVGKAIYDGDIKLDELVKELDA